MFRTDLEEILNQRGIRAVVMVGTTANGAPMYTAMGATVREYLVVVAEDAISATTPFETLLARYQLLNQPGRDNPRNEPLRPNAVTLTRTDLITLQ